MRVVRVEPEMATDSPGQTGLTAPIIIIVGDPCRARDHRQMEMQYCSTV